MAQISVTLTADIKRLESALKDVRKQLTNTGDLAEKEAAKIGATGGKGAKGITKLGKAAGNAVPTLNEFGRIIQDAPFGIQGVANNITQLVDNFGNLSRSSGGAGGALKALAGSLLGPAGILVAVSAITSALVAYGPQIKEFILQTSEAEKAQKEFNKAVNEGIGAAQGELAVLDSLVSVARNESASKQERLRAIRKINDQYGEYLPNLNLENVNTQKVTTALDKYSTALIRNAKIKGAQSLISEKFAEILELEQSSAIDNVGALDVIATAFTTVGQAGQQSADLVTRGFKNQGEAITEAEKRIESLRKVIQSLITEDLGAGGIFTSVPTPDPKKATNTKAKQTTDPLDSIFAVDPSKLETRAKILQEAVTSSIQSIDNAQREGFNRVLEGANQFSDQYAQILESNARNAVLNFATSIGDALATGGNIIQSAGSSILGAIGQLAVDLGKMVIAQGIAIEAVKTALKTLSGPIAIAAGAALVAIGSGFKAGASRLASGVSGSGGGFTSGGGGTFTGASSSVSTSGGFGGTVVFEIQGTKLVGVLNRTLKKDRRSVADII